MEKGDFVEVTIEDMSSEGNGIGKVPCDGGLLTVFVDGAVVGDRVRAGINGVKKNYATAKVTGFIERSAHRLPENEVCPYIHECGGCPYGMLDYETQLRLKEKQVKDKLERLGGVDFDTTKLNPIVPMDELHHYRDKATIAVYNDIVGFKSKKSNYVIDCEKCLIQNERANQAAWALRTYIFEEKLEGLFAKMVVRTTGLDETMAVLYTADYLEKDAAGSKNKGGRNGGKTGGKASGKGKAQSGRGGNKFDPASIDLEKLAYGIDDAVENTLESIWINDKLIAGKNTVLDHAGNLDFEISPLSFYQVNPVQMLKLYGKVVELADLKGDETVLDLYCGIGTIGLFMADEMNRRAAENGLTPGMVYGIESVKPAIIDANRNAVINHIVNARYFCGKAEEELPFMMGMTRLYKNNEVNEQVERIPEVMIEHADIAVLDPPRAGCDKRLLDAVIKAAPDRIIYVSCDAGTLARDIRYLTDGCAAETLAGETASAGDETAASYIDATVNGPYRLIEVTPVDMFGHTGHVECVSLLCRVG